MVYKKYLEKGRKKYNPYYYVPIRTFNKKSKLVNKNYRKLPKPPKPPKNYPMANYSTPRTGLNHASLFHASLAVLIMVLVAFVLVNNPTITGFVTGVTEDYTVSFNQSISESQDYTWELPGHPNLFYLKSISMSGSVIGDGDVRVYISDGTNQYQILDSNNLVEEISPISGFTMAISGKSITVSDLSVASEDGCDSDKKEKKDD